MHTKKINRKAKKQGFDQALLLLGLTSKPTNKPRLKTKVKLVYEKEC